MSNPRLSIIAALSENLVIGRDNELPWHIKADMQRLKSITMGHPLIMGRKTFDSIGIPLPGRTSIVISRDHANLSLPPEVKKAGSLDEAIATAKNCPGGDSEIFIFGGGQIFKEAISKVDRLYLTIVHEQVNGDVYFPDYSEFKKILDEETGEENGRMFTFLTLER